MRFKPAAIFILSILLLSGCAVTTPTSTSETKDAPTERVLAFQTQPPQEFAKLVVTRDQGFGGSACYFALWINGTLAARLGTSERAHFFVSPGDHILRTGRDPMGGGLCGFMVNNWTQRETVIRSNETKYFRFLINDGVTDIQRTDP